MTKQSEINQILWEACDTFRGGKSTLVFIKTMF